MALEVKVDTEKELVQVDATSPDDLSGRKLVEFSATLQGELVQMRLKDKEWVVFTLEEFSLLGQSMVPALQAIERERRKAAVPTVDSEWEHIESLSESTVGAKLPCLRLILSGNISRPFRASSSSSWWITARR